MSERSNSHGGPWKERGLFTSQSPSLTTNNLRESSGLTSAVLSTLSLFFYLQSCFVNTASSSPLISPSTLISLYHGSPSAQTDAKLQLRPERAPRGSSAGELVQSRLRGKHAPQYTLRVFHPLSPPELTTLSNAAASGPSRTASPRARSGTRRETTTTSALWRSIILATTPSTVGSPPRIPTASPRALQLPFARLTPSARSLRLIAGLHLLTRTTSLLALL